MNHTTNSYSKPWVLLFESSTFTNLCPTHIICTYSRGASATFQESNVMLCLNTSQYLTKKYFGNYGELLCRDCIPFFLGCFNLTLPRVMSTKIYLALLICDLVYNFAKIIQTLWSLPSLSETLSGVSIADFQKMADVACITPFIHVLLALPFRQFQWNMRTVVLPYHLSLASCLSIRRV